MMSYSDNQYFAPESYTDGKGRRILFAWVFDGRNEMVRNRSGWSGTMSLPRVMTLGADNRLLMTPADELKALRYNETVARNVTVSRNGQAKIAFDGVDDNVLEIEAELRGGGAEEFGVKVCCSSDGRQETAIGYNAAECKLKIDTTHTGPNMRVPLPITNAVSKAVEAAPMRLGGKETLKLRIFVDRSIVEVFANDGRQALSRTVYPAGGATGIKLYSKGGSAKASSVRVWDIMPANPY
jgi:beta-fructofuranosidase